MNTGRVREGCSRSCGACASRNKICSYIQYGRPPRLFASRRSDEAHHGVVKKEKRQKHVKPNQHERRTAHSRREWGGEGSKRRPQYEHFTVEIQTEQQYAGDEVQYLVSTSAIHNSFSALIEPIILPKAVGFGSVAIGFLSLPLSAANPSPDSFSPPGLACFHAQEKSEQKKEKKKVKTLEQTLIFSHPVNVDNRHQQNKK